MPNTLHIYSNLLSLIVSANGTLEVSTEINQIIPYIGLTSNVLLIEIVGTYSKMFSSG